MSDQTTLRQVTPLIVLEHFIYWALDDLHTSSHKKSKPPFKCVAGDYPRIP